MCLNILNGGACIHFRIHTAVKCEGALYLTNTDMDVGINVNMTIKYLGGAALLAKSTTIIGKNASLHFINNSRGSGRAVHV